MSTILQTIREAMSTPADRLDEVFDERCDLRGRAEQALFFAGDASDAVYLLVSGCARAYVGERHTSRTTLLFRGPALLGDRDVLANCHARDTVRLVTKAKLITWSREEFLAEWEMSEELRSLVTDDLARRYATTISWIELDSIHVTDRLNSLLDSVGMPQPSIDDMAAMLGLSRRSIFRALAELRERKVKPRAEAHDDAVPLVHSLVEPCTTEDFSITPSEDDADGMMKASSDTPVTVAS